MSTTETTVQLLNRRDAITSRIATYRQPGVPVREEDAVELETVMGEIEARRVAAGADPRVAANHEHHTKPLLGCFRCILPVPELLAWLDSWGPRGEQERAARRLRIKKTLRILGTPFTLRESRDERLLRALLPAPEPPAPPTDDIDPAHGYEVNGSFWFDLLGRAFGPFTSKKDANWYARDIQPRLKLVENMRRGWLFKDTKGAIWQWLRKDGALEGVFHAERQSDGLRSVFCGTAAFEVTSEPCPHLAQDDIDPALYGLPQDSEIGPEVYPATKKNPKYKPGHKRAGDGYLACGDPNCCEPNEREARP